MVSNMAHTLTQTQVHVRAHQCAKIGCFHDFTIGGAFTFKMMEGRKDGREEGMKEGWKEEVRREEKRKKVLFQGRAPSRRSSFLSCSLPILPGVLS